jgi:hypothetical protein
LTSLCVNTLGEVALSGDGEFEGFTVYKGHSYCEACHVRLRYQNASSANARFEIMMKQWRLLEENGVGDISFAL